MLPWVPETFHGRFPRFRSSLTAPVTFAAADTEAAFFSHASKKTLTQSNLHVHIRTKFD